MSVRRGGGCGGGSPSLGDLLTARPAGLLEPETWAILCQAVQALQDLFLSDGASGDACVPLVTPATLVLSSRGRVKLFQSTPKRATPAATGYLAPEYRTQHHKNYSDTEFEKMWIYSLGETLKRATLTSHSATQRLSSELCQVLTDMTRVQTTTRATLMHLLDVISGYCARKQQNRPFSHIVMDLHQEAMAAVEMVLDTPWGPPAMQEIRPRTRQKSETITESFGTIPRRWLDHLDQPPKAPLAAPTTTREASTSMEDLTSLQLQLSTAPPGSIVRPKSLCVSDFRQVSLEDATTSLPCKINSRLRRNPVQRAASRLYRAAEEDPCTMKGDFNTWKRDCIGPEFVVRASLPNKLLTMPDCKGNVRKSVTVIMLNGQKLDVLCNPNATTAGQLFEMIIQKEHIEENFMLGLSALIAGDFVFLPSDTRICKAFPNHQNNNTSLTLFMRIRFFLPSLRGIRGAQARHLLYLQLRRSILEHQLPCSFTQLIELNGLALQAEFGNFNEKEHGTRDYFLLEHYVPETMFCAIEHPPRLRQELIKAHKTKSGLEAEKAEEDFIIVAQKLPHYGGHFYTATWMLKDNNHKEVWLYISAQGINLYERGKSSTSYGPQLYEMFEWRSIQTLCYSKQYLCILPHANLLHTSKLKKYKLRMDNKKSYFTFRLASLHHQFFLRLRTEFTSLQSLSQQFGIPLKDMKNETNSLYKLEALTHEYMTIDQASVNADTEFKIDFRTDIASCNKFQRRRSKSFDNIEEIQNKENELPGKNGLILQSSCLSGFQSTTDKRRGVKMGTRAFSNARVSRSMSGLNTAYLEQLDDMSLASVSLHCSSTSISRSSTGDCLPSNEEAYILDSTLKSCSNNQFLPDFQESLNETLVDKLNTMSFAEERVLLRVTIERDSKGSLGLQITEGSDGNVYVQSVIKGGPAFLAGNIQSGDQVVAVDTQHLLGMKYNEALNFLKNRGSKVEFVLSRMTPRKNLVPLIKSQSPIEKHLTECCRDSANLRKYGHQMEVPYHKHIRYEIDQRKILEKKSFSKSCTQLFEPNNRAVVVEMIPKAQEEGSNVLSLDRRQFKQKVQTQNSPQIALPRSLGLSRKWRGPVRYPVTPVKKTTTESLSDEEQVFI